MTAASQPLLFLGDRRQHALETRIADALRRWRQSWVREATETFDVTVVPPAAGGWTGAVAGATTSVWMLDAGAERVAALLLPHTMFAWVVQEAGAGSLDTIATVGPESLAEQLEQEVAQSLLAELCLAEKRDAESVTRATPEAVSQWSRESRAWTLHARAAQGGRGCSVLLAASRVEMLAPVHAPKAGTPLGLRRDAIGENALSLRAVVGEASMSVSELAELALDDVLVLDQHLSEPVMLVSPVTGSPVAAGNLGRAGARRAIKIAGPAHKH